MTFGPADWFKKATMFAYTRISTDEQSVQDSKVKDPKKKVALKRQFKEINDLLKKQGLPQVKKDNWFAEVASGVKEDRPEWLALRKAAMNHRGKAVVAVKDPTRWARNVDAGVMAWKPLKERGIPIYAVATGIQTGSVNDRRPSESFFFLLNSGFASQTSEIQQKKAEAAVERQIEEGVAAFKGSSVYPFARKDPLIVMNENLHVLDGPKGTPRLKRRIEEDSMPLGIPFTATANFLKRELARKAVLTPQEYKDYLDFRERLRMRMKRIGYDAWEAHGNKSPKKLDYRSNALYRMTGLYLKEPEKFPMPTEDFLDEVETDFVTYLSDKDKKRRSKK